MDEQLRTVRTGGISTVAGQMLDTDATEFATYVTRAAGNTCTDTRMNYAALLLYQDGDGQYPYWEKLKTVNTPGVYTAAARLISEMLCSGTSSGCYTDYANTATKLVGERYENRELYADEAYTYYQGCCNCQHVPFRDLCARLGTNYRYSDRYYGEPTTIGAGV